MATPWIRIQSALLAAVVTAALATHLILRRPARRIYQDYSLLALNLSLWFLADALHALFLFGSAILDTVRLGIATSIPLTVHRFMVTLLEDRSGAARRLGRWLTICAVMALGVVVVVPLRDALPTGLGTAAMLAYLFGGVSASLLLLRQRLAATESAAERGRLTSLLVAGGLATSLTLLDYLPGVGFFFFGNIFVTLFLYFLFQIITQLRLLDLYEFLGRSVVTLTFSLVIAAIFLFLTVFWRDRAELFVFNTVIAAMVVIILFEPLKNAVGGWISQFLFSERFAFSAKVDQLYAAIARLVDPFEVASTLVNGLDDSRRVTHASVYLMTGSTLKYDLKAFVGSMPRQAIDAVADRPLLEALREERVLTLEGLDDALRSLRDIESAAAAERREQVRRVRVVMDEMHAGVVLPLRSGDRILGLLALNDERVREAYSTEELAALVKLANQAAVALENTRVYEKLRERDRLAALGEMSAGLAHEIRNPLGAIKGAAQLLADEEADAEGQRDLALVVSEEVDRLNAVVTQFLHFAKPYRSLLQPCDLNDVLQRTLQLLEARRGPELTVEVDLDEALPEVWTDPEMVRTIFLNLALNAFEAMEDKGRLTIRTSLRGRSRGGHSPVGDGQAVTVEFSDDGPGIHRNDLEHIFIPFFTTKTRGTGLGLSICQRVIKSLGGWIEVHSPTGRGATFLVHLPVGAGPTTGEHLVPNAR